MKVFTVLAPTKCIKERHPLVEFWDPLVSPEWIKGARVVGGFHTDFVFTEFSDRWFIILTQFEKLGTLVHVCQDVALESPGTTTYRTQVLMGADDLETNVIARNLASLVNTKKPILFALALQDKSQATVRELSDIVSTHCSMTG